MWVRDLVREVFTAILNVGVPRMRACVFWTKQVPNYDVLERWKGAKTVEQRV